jgi:hypothetical protein
MKSMKWMMVALFAVASTHVQASQYAWASIHGDDTDEWDRVANWWWADGGQPTEAPGTDDNVLIGAIFSNTQLDWPVMNTTVAVSNLFLGGGKGTPGKDGELTIESGADLTVGGAFRLGSDGGDGLGYTGTLYMTGGSMVSDVFAVGMNGSEGIAYMSGDASITVNTFFTFREEGTGTIYMADSSMLTVAGDKTGLANDRIIASLGGESISASYDGSSTTFTVIPEPATLGLVAAVGGAVLFIRRRFMM